MPKSLVIVGGILVATLPWMSGGSDPLAVLISAFGLLIAWFLLARRPSQQRVATMPLRFMVMLWLGWGILSLLWTVSRYDTELWLLYAGLGVLVFATASSLDAIEKAHLLAGYVWVAVVTAIYGIYLYLTGDYDRLTSTFYWANPCAAYLIPAAFLAGWRWLLLKRPDRWGLVSWVSLLQTLILGLAIWLTDSRGALLAAAIVLIAVFARRPLRTKTGYGLALVVLTFGLSLGAVAIRTHFLHQASVTPGSRFAAAAEGESTSLSDRRNYLISAVQIWQQHPLQGSGPGTYGTVHPHVQQRVISASNDAHNFLVQTLAEQGLIGVLIVLYGLIVVLVGVRRGLQREPQYGVVAAGAIVVLLHFGIDIDDRYPALIAILAMLLGVSYQPWRAWQVRGWHRWRVPAVVAGVLILSISAYQSHTWDMKGQAADTNHDLTTAAADYAKAHTGLMYDPDTWTAEGIDYYTLASITGGSTRYSPLAKDRAQQAIARDPDDSQHYLLLARVQRLDGQLSAAETTYKQALRLDPWNHPDYYVDLATLQLQRGEITAAQRTVQKGLNPYPDSVIANRNADASIKPAVAQLLALQAADRLQRGNTAGARQDVSRALRLDPTSQDAKALQAHLQ